MYLRDRPLTETQAMNLNVIKQAHLSQKMTELQRKDAELAFNQNQSIRRLTVVNMVYLPATFIAVSDGGLLLQHHNS
jgi:Mg2+ and Co2+ transporter CorA